MLRPLLYCLVFVLATACVPKKQYDGLVIERDYYRNQVAETDSLADERVISTYNEVPDDDRELERRIRQVEQLTATNITLNNSYQDLKTRYEKLLDQNQKMLTVSGDETTALQNTLAERTAAVAAREAEIRQMELDLRAREDALARTQSRGGDAQPTGYGTVVAPNTGRATLSGQSNAALRVNQLQNDLAGLMSYLPRDQYDLFALAGNRLNVTLQEATLTTDGYSISPAGQELIRGLGTTLRNYPEAEILIVGHASDPNPVSAYENSTDKAINVVQQLITYGVDPAKITAAGRGAYDPVANNATAEGQRANRRTNIVVTMPPTPR